jgi:hypothetical protein
MLRKGAAPVGRGALAALRFRSENAVGGPEDTPLQKSEQEREAELAAQAALPSRRPVRAYWIGLGVGSGIGYQLGRDLEHHPNQGVGSGLVLAGLGHLGLEFGWQWRERIGLSVQTRHQYLPTSGSGDPAVTGSPPTWAHAIFAHASYAWREWGDLQLLATGTVGGGSAFRLKVSPTEILRTSDTIDGGPIVVAPGIGAQYNFGRRMVAFAESRLLIGVWKLATMLDITAGAQYTF